MTDTTAPVVRTSVVLLPKEPVLVSWMRDAFSFGCLAGLLLLNHYLLGDNGFLTVFICLIWFLWLISKAIRANSKGSVTVTIDPKQVRELLASVTVKD